MEIPDDEDLISEDILAKYRRDDVIYGHSVSLEAKVLGAATIFLMFLIFLILISWDHYKDDIKALYFRDLKGKYFFFVEVIELDEKMMVFRPRRKFQG